MEDEILLFTHMKAGKFKLSNEDYDGTIVTEDVVDQFQIKRTQASRLLNNLVRKEKLIKINTRPVKFISKQAIENNEGKASKTVYSDLNELYLDVSRHEQDWVFDGLIGRENSLKEVVEQIKISVCYPNNGLPIMFTGETGVGKSYMAQLLYDYCKSKRLLANEAPFHTLNCAQYYNNPELLSSLLFGYAKGAFTGADEDSIGLLEEADGGVLFLDEVHRLSSEGQEKLFTFMDQGIFTRIGDGSRVCRSTVRLVFATTENINVFLKTFLRRIPIHVYVPNIEERGPVEKNKMIEHFFYQESQILGIPVEVTQLALEGLNQAVCPGNIGDFKNIVKYACGKAYSLGNKKNGNLFVTFQDLPSVVYKNQEELIRPTKDIQRSVVFSLEGNTTSKKNNGDSKSLMINDSYMECLNYFQRFLNHEYNETLFYEKSFEIIISMMDRLVFDKAQDKNNVRLEFITAKVQEIFRNLEIDYSKDYDGNNVYVFSTYFYFKSLDLERGKGKRDTEQQLLEFLKDKNPKEYRSASKIARLIKNRLDIYLGEEDLIIIILFLKATNCTSRTNTLNAMILAHGYATASSIANISNRMLGANVFDSIDMPFDASVSDVSRSMTDYLKENECKDGIVVLIDMGSLNLIYEELKNIIKGPVLFIDQIATASVLEVGQLLLKESDLEQIAEEMTKTIQPKVQLYYPKKEKELAIVTSCFTGIGTAIQIQNLLNESLSGLVDVRVIAHDYEKLRSNGLNEPPFQLNKVLAVIGTADPHIKGVSFIMLEDIISGKREESFYRVFADITDSDTIKRINNRMIKNFSLTRVIETVTILDTKKIMSKIEGSLNQMEQTLKLTLSNQKKVALYVHISCMIERLVRNAAITEYPQIEEFVKKEQSRIKLIQYSLSVLESNYSVNIPLAEIGYIYSILFAGA